jgi:glucokinase
MVPELKGCPEGIDVVAGLAEGVVFMPKTSGHNERLVVGVDLGGTKILTAVVADGKTILGRSKVPTPAKDGALAILDAIVGSIDESLYQAGVPREKIAGIGIGSPGPLNSSTGVILFSANLNVHDFALAPELSKRFAKPALLQNDVRVGGYGEFKLGAGQGYKNILAAFVGTGVGGCLIMDGKIVEGATGNAGELGHIIVKTGGPECNCGSRGCLEAFSSRTAITRRVAKSVRHGHATLLAGKIDKKTGRLKSGDLAMAIEAKDPVALKEVHRAAHYLGLGLGSLVNVLGPEIVIIGGGVTEALGETLVDMIRPSFRKTVLVDPEEQIKLVPASLGDDAGVLGAALFAFEKYVK